LAAMLAVSHLAPSKSDLHQFSIVRVDDAEGRRIVMGPGPVHNNDSLDTFLNASLDAGLALGLLEYT
jgi:hypothetical protein